MFNPWKKKSTNNGPRKDLLMGEYILAHEMTDNTLGMKFMVDLFIPTTDIEIADKYFLQLGIDVISVDTSGNMKVVLPDRWICCRTGFGPDDTYMIFDNLGRARVLCIPKEKRYVFYCRYSYRIHYSSIKSELINKTVDLLSLEILDRELPAGLDFIPIDVSDLRDKLEKENDTVSSEMIIEHAKEIIEANIRAEVPGWGDPMRFWDE